MMLRASRRLWLLQVCNGRLTHLLQRVPSPMLTMDRRSVVYSHHNLVSKVNRLLRLVALKSKAALKCRLTLLIGSGSRVEGSGRLPWMSVHTLLTPV